MSSPVGSPQLPPASQSRTRPDHAPSSSALGLPTFTVVVLGDGAVGKSALTVQWCKNTFDSAYSPTIEDYFRKQLRLNDEAMIVDILDTAGQEEYAALLEQYYAKGDGFLMVYSITSRTSFDDVPNFRTHALRVQGDLEFPAVLCGNKVDLSPAQRNVTEQEGRDLARSFRVPFFETSAKTRLNVDQAFEELTKLMRAYAPKKAERTRLQDEGGPIDDPHPKCHCTLV